MMLKYTTVGIAVFDAQELRLQSANALYLKSIHAFFGDQATDEGYIGQSIIDWSKKTHTQDVISIFRKVTTTGIPYRTREIMLRSPVRGDTYWDWILEPVRDQAGDITHIVQTVNDVTEHVVAREDAEAAQMSLNQVNQTITEERERLKIISIIASSIRESLDTQHIAEIAIETICQHLTALSACLYIADQEQRVFRALHQHKAELHKESLKALRYIPYERLTFAKDVLHKHEPIVIEDLQIAAGVDKNDPLRHIGTRGYLCMPLWYGEHLEGMFVVLFARTIKADGPELKMLEGCCMHISSAIAHGRLHAALDHERSRMSITLDHFPDSILIVAATTGAISYANPAAAQALDVSLDSMRGSLIHQYATRSPFINIIDGKPILPWDFFVVRALCGEVINGKETLVTKPNGSRAFMLASCAPLYTDDKIMIETVIVFQDITTQKKLEQHKSEFLSIANHELRTPITIIQGFAELLQLKAPQLQEKSLDSLTQYALNSIIDQSQHLTRLIEEMLNISRIEQGQFTLRCEHCNLVELVQGLIERQAMTNHQHQLQLVLDGVPSNNTVIGYIDEERIIQALNNLVSNAVKYSKLHSKIEVGLRYNPQKPHEALIWVQDQGIDIPQEELPLNFERFRRGKNINHTASGFGIGLYLVKEIIGRHNGKVWAESSKEKGSTFYVALPLKAQLTVPDKSEN